MEKRGCRPDEQLNVCDTVPDGFTDVTEVDALMPKRFAYFSFVLIAASRILRMTFSSRTTAQSHWPVIETPKSRSSSQLFFQSSEI